MLTQFIIKGAAGGGHSSHSSSSGHSSSGHSSESSNTNHAESRNYAPYIGYSNGHTLPNQDTEPAGSFEYIAFALLVILPIIAIILMWKISNKYR